MVLGVVFQVVEYLTIQQLQFAVIHSILQLILGICLNYCYREIPELYIRDFLDFDHKTKSLLKI